MSAMAQLATAAPAMSALPAAANHGSSFPKQVRGSCRQQQMYRASPPQEPVVSFNMDPGRQQQMYRAQTPQRCISMQRGAPSQPIQGASFRGASTPHRGGSPQPVSNGFSTPMKGRGSGPPTSRNASIRTLPYRETSRQRSTPVADSGPRQPNADSFNRYSMRAAVAPPPTNVDARQANVDAMNRFSMRAPANPKMPTIDSFIPRQESFAFQAKPRQESFAFNPSPRQESFAFNAKRSPSFASATAPTSESFAVGRMPSVDSFAVARMPSVDSFSVSRQDSFSVHRTPRVQMAPLNALVCPGDVICIKGSVEGITRLGAAGGFMGHVLLITQVPKMIAKGSEDSIMYLNMWPDTQAGALFVFSTLESCRSHSGFHETKYYLYFDEAGYIRVIGEGPISNLLKYDEGIKVDLFRSPPELRALLRPHVVEEVLNTMRSGYQGSWSWSTAIQAYLFSADMSARDVNKNHDAIMESLERSWAADPICSSVVIVFWQRYLCAISQEACNAGMDASDAIDTAINRIYQFMPLKADCSLPGDLMSTMQQLGWDIMSDVTSSHVNAMPHFSRGHVESNAMLVRHPSRTRALPRSRTPVPMMTRQRSGPA